MKPQDSILGRLTRSLAAVASVGALLMLIVIGIEYLISFARLYEKVSPLVMIHELSEHVIIPMLLLAAPMAVAGRWAIRRSVKPLEAAAERIDAAQGEARGFRIDASTLPLETVPFANAVNNMLDRVDRTAALHEAFAADIAHELRTPLTLLSLELDRLGGAKADQLKLDVAAMRRLIDQLLLMAQIEAEQAAHLPPAPVDLMDVASEVIARMAPAALAAGQTLELHGEAGAPVPGRREAVAAALRNLVENALRVTPVDVPVLILADRPGELAVRDGGAGLSPERLEALVQRLRRADNASKDGAGLGLAIVARIMAAHGGSLVTDPEKRELRLKFPLA